MEITKQRIKELLRAEDKLNALEGAGVDNWDFYGEALKEYDAENELEENREKLIHDLEVIFGECAFEPSERGAGIAFNDDAFDKVMIVLNDHNVTFGEELVE